MKDLDQLEKSVLREKIDKPIYVTVPASTAYDLGKMRKVTEIVLGRLGCASCHSGFDLRFDFERRFVFDEKLALQPQHLAFS
ncbi:MAG TPA: hypothetical protein VLB84_10760 [Bacteroidia bacterium]|jgi:hypothetical protein|nr:hypothetical protein [Bacteroidia bacterium]